MRCLSRNGFKAPSTGLMSFDDATCCTGEWCYVQCGIGIAGLDGPSGVGDY